LSAVHVLELDGLTVEHRDIRRLRAIGHRLERDARLAVVIRASPEPNTVLRTRSILQTAGFLVEAVEACESGGTRIHARRVLDPPDSLAVAAWGAGYPDTVLDLRYAPDETEWLDPQPHEVWSRAIASTMHSGAELVSHYPVDDPFGAVRAAPAVSRAFGCPLDKCQVTFGAGVTSLLHDLCGLSDGGPIACPPLVHADLEARAFSKGISIRVVPEPTDPDALVRAIMADPPALLHLDRPTFTGHMMDLAAVVAIADAAAHVGAPVVIDEAGATYVQAVASAVSLVNRSKNLVVLRGFTKAYSWGGLRCGFAVASRDVSAAVRALVAPMQVSEVALAAVLRLLESGDCLGRLRLQIRLMKASTALLLASCGLKLIPGHPDLPWIALDDHDRAASALFDHCGIRPLRPVSHSCIAPVPPTVRVTVPLSYSRLERLKTLLRQSAQGGIMKDQQF
jgi:histidinol-phosphate/aromatic aminotransferase/cobyric acid decarboxylase-like protein